MQKAEKIPNAINKTIIIITTHCASVYRILLEMEEGNALEKAVIRKRNDNLIAFDEAESLES